MTIAWLAPARTAQPDTPASAAAATAAMATAATAAPRRAANRVLASRIRPASCPRTASTIAAPRGQARRQFRRGADRETSAARPIRSARAAPYDRVVTRRAAPVAGFPHGLAAP